MIENRLCKNCKNRKTMNCPNSSECYYTKTHPYFVPVNTKEITEDNLLNISNTLENILYVLERIEKKLYEDK